MVDSTLISAETSVATLNSELVGYSIRRQIGHGAMGIVYEAEQKNLGRRVAIKILPPNLAMRERTVKRFLREAEAMGRLGHANIVDVYEVGSVRSTHFFSMKYVEGPPLDRVLRAGPLAVKDVLAIGLDVAAALAHAHSRGVMHRDIKPGNLLRDGERVVLTDFGLARPLDTEDAGSMTESGDLVGTPLYMSPEQISGDSEHIDGRADVWGLGVTLYELLTQRPPFTAQNAQGILHAILHRDPPRLSKVRDDVPRDLEAVVHRCLEKDPTRRYAGAAALLADLEAVRDGSPVSARPPRFFDPAVRWVRRHPVEAGIVAASLLVTVTLAVVLRLGWIYFGTRITGLLKDTQVAQEQSDDLRRERDLIRVERDAIEREGASALHARLTADALNELADANIRWAEGKTEGNERKCREAELCVSDLFRARELDEHPDVRAEMLAFVAAWARQSGRRHEQVLADLEGWAEGVAPGVARLYRAAILTGLGDYSGALFVHQQRASADPLDPRPLADAARVRHRMALDAQDAFDGPGFTEQIAQAIRLFDSGLTLAIAARDREQVITILVERARCYLDAHDALAARRDLLLALREQPRHVEAQAAMLATDRALETDAPRAKPLFDDPEHLPDDTSTTTGPAEAQPSAADYESALREAKRVGDFFKRLLPGAAPAPSAPGGGN